jgi:hypothetical protein
VPVVAAPLGARTPPLAGARLATTVPRGRCQAQLELAHPPPLAGLDSQRLFLAGAAKLDLGTSLDAVNNGAPVKSAQSSVAVAPCRAIVFGSGAAAELADEAMEGEMARLISSSNARRVAEDGALAYRGLV